MSGGMIPKIAACIHRGRARGGPRPTSSTAAAHVVLLELFTDAGVGTMITGGRPPTGDVGPHVHVSARR